jgi:hypothetical protein
MKIDSLDNENWILRCENQELKKKVVDLENIIADLQMQTCRKHNERKAGRKEYQDKDIIKRIFRMYSQGMSFQRIADKLNSEKIPTKAGGAWAKSSIRFIFNNESYIEKGVLSEKEYNLDFS